MNVMPKKYLHTSTRIPVDDEYAARIGKAVYVFAYYEWTIIYLTDHLKPSEKFVRKYSRGKENHTSRKVLKAFRKAHEKPEVALSKDVRKMLKECAEDFDDLIDSRNALVHAHPITDVSGEQILSFQSDTDKKVSDMKWTAAEVESFIEKVDVKIQLASACHAAAKAASTA